MSVCLLKGYAAILFAEHPGVGFLFLLATFWSPWVGFSGLLCAWVALITARLFRFNNLDGNQHIYNAILTGLSLGVLFNFTPKLLVLLVLSGFLVVFITVIIVSSFWRMASLPVLSLPFVITAIPIHLLAAKYMPQGAHYFSETNQYAFFTSLGATFFSPHPVVGLLLFLGMLWSSYYAALLALTGFLVGVIVFNYFAIAPPAQLLEWTGFNLMLTSMAIGGIFTVPGRHSFILALLGSALAAILIVVLENVFFEYGPFTFVLPFLCSTCCILLALQQRLVTVPPWLTLTHPQLPEKSYRTFRLMQARKAPYPHSVALHPPFYGTWQVYQGFFGPHTHQPPWQYALDFFIQSGGHSFRNDGTALDDYFCFGLPILAPASGTVVYIENQVHDNIPGETYVKQPWGNYILIQREDGYFVLLAHLKQYSVQVVIGTKIDVGQVVAACGNSGRSLQPHVHLQVQSLALVGSATHPFHFVGVVSHTFCPVLCPTVGASVQRVEKNVHIAHCFQFLAGRYYRFRFQEPGGAWVNRTLQVKLNLYGQFRLENEQGGSCVFETHENMLIFHQREGRPDSFLDIFILSLSITPYTDQTSKWEDAPSSALLPLPTWKQWLFSFLQPLDPGLKSRYRRTWDVHYKCWRQTGEHRRQGIVGIQNSLSTEVVFYTEQPFMCITAHLGKKSWVLELLAMGQTADAGVPAWEQNLTNPIGVF